MGILTTLEPAPELDSSTILAAQSGDEHAHAAIYSHYAPRLYTLIYRLVPRRAHAEDLLQDVFIEVLRSIATYSANGSFGGWLRAIAVNKSLMLMRSPWHRSMLWIDESPEQLRDANGVVVSIDGACDTQRDLEVALRHLTPTARAVVWLHDVEGYTHGEIAHSLGRTTSFSKSQLARAHERLRELLINDTETLSCPPATQSLSISS
jgi:RNA polymerase sigma factor (sigma-70 family)